MRLGLTAAALLWFTRGLLVVSEAEQVIVTRCGRYQATLSAGFHWRWPPPLEVVRRERVAEVRTLPIGFRSPSVPTSSINPTPVAPIEWTSPHGNEHADAFSPESLTMTGDEVPVELTAEVRYRIADLKAFVHASATPESILNAAADSSIRQVIARVSLDDILTSQRQRIETLALEQLRQTLSTYQIGVEVLSIELLDVHPPKQVVLAYRQVADALEQREQLVNEAEAYYARKLLGVAGEAAIRDWSTSVEHPQRRGDSTTGAVVSWSLVDELWSKAIHEDGDRPMMLTGEAAARLHEARQEKSRRIQQSASSSARFISLWEQYAQQPKLVMSHLYWDAVISGLLGKPLTIVDPAVGSRRQLWLLDESQPKIPLAVPGASEGSGKEGEESRIGNGR